MIIQDLVDTEGSPEARSELVLPSVDEHITVIPLFEVGTQQFPIVTVLSISEVDISIFSHLLYHSLHFPVELISILTHTGVFNGLVLRLTFHHQTEWDVQFSPINHLVR